MKPLYGLVLAAFLPLAAAAQEGFAPVPADSVALEDMLYLKRPVVVFADTPNDPAFVRQMELIALGADDLAERDVIVVTDTDPAAKTAWRTKLRPRGFSLVLMDKDGKVIAEKELTARSLLVNRELGKVTLGDEFTPDGCRIWDAETREKLDKDRFRQDLGGLLEAYQEVARRLGIMNENEPIRGTGPVLVK